MEEGKKGKRNFVKKHPFLAAVLLSAAAGLCVSMVAGAGIMAENLFRGLGVMGVLEVFASLFWGMVCYGGFLFFPFVLTAAEIILLVRGRRNRELYQRGRIFDIVGMFLAVFYSGFYMSLFKEVLFEKDWQEQLINAQMHTPVFTEAQPTVAVVLSVAVAGYFVVNFIPLKKMPPLVLVLGLAAMYLGTAVSLVWGIQIFRMEFLDFLLLLPPLNCTILTARTVSHKMWEWNQRNEAGDPESEQLSKLEEVWEDRQPAEIRTEEQSAEGGGVLGWCSRFLQKSEHWPLAAFLLMWPLLGILTGILVLFGQRPDAIIKAFTETSDWNLSQRVAPQNLHIDEHYLCTVAAGGHERIVKPKRLGVRHGHQVIVNRQLCVANAFEQILEERTPRFHRAVRHFYDTCGFPVAKLIRSRYTADLIYFLMKPLEWLFLIVLYLTDVNPENRIALQYTGKSLKDFE